MLCGRQIAVKNDHFMPLWGTPEIVVSDLGKQLMNEGHAVVARRLDLEVVKSPDTRSFLWLLNIVTMSSLGYYC